VQAIEPVQSGDSVHVGSCVQSPTVQSSPIVQPGLAVQGVGPNVSSSDCGKIWPRISPLGLTFVWMLM
jgi:hypothetical protein